jgi:hypothetical protein
MIAVLPVLRSPMISSLAVDRPAERVDDPAQEGVADGHREDPPRGLHRVARLDRRHVAQDDAADLLLVQVEGQTEQPPGKLEDLVDGGAGQPGDAGDAVAHLDDLADPLRGQGRREVAQMLLEDGGDVVGADGHLGHR